MRFKVIINDAELSAEMFEKIDGLWESIDFFEADDIDSLYWTVFEEMMYGAGCEPDGCRIYTPDGKVHMASLV